MNAVLVLLLLASLSCNVLVSGVSFRRGRKRGFELGSAIKYELEPETPAPALSPKMLHDDCGGAWGKWYEQAMVVKPVVGDRSKDYEALILGRKCERCGDMQRKKSAAKGA